jgi:tetratricopeptide (TPR) repeat protein
VQSFEVLPWPFQAGTWIAAMVVDGCPTIPGPDNEYHWQRPYLWLALASLPAAPVKPALLASPAIGHLFLANSRTLHIGLQDPVQLGSGRTGFTVTAQFSIPFGGGGADCVVDYLIQIQDGRMRPVFSMVSAYSAMYGGDWNEDGTRDHPEENESLSWSLSNRRTKGQANIVVSELEDGVAKGRKATYAWDGDHYQSGAKPFFPNQDMVLEEAPLTEATSDQIQAWVTGEAARLLAAGDAHGLMNLELAYSQEIWSGPDLFDTASRQRILVLAHSLALATYKADPQAALRLLGYGIGQQVRSVVGPADADNQPPFFELLQKENEVDKAAALNDYAFILATKTKGNGAKAATLLSQVLALDPKRAVAYLNLADVLWNLGKKGEAKAHYARYLELSDKEAKDVPEKARARAR